MKYTAIYESGENNWSAYLPDMPGCVATGSDRAETAKNLASALQMHIETMLEDGDAIPRATDYRAGSGEDSGVIEIEVRTAVAA